MSKNRELGINEVKITGIVEEAPVYDHSVFGEKFYHAIVRVHRDKSDAKDLIPFTVSEKLINCESLTVGTAVNITGQFRSFNKRDEETEKRHLIISVFCKDIEIVDVDEACFCNEIKLGGFICKKPLYRTTPKGREISDILVAVNRSYGRSDYIPCIAWGRNAKYTDRQLTVGSPILIEGRIQSRTYYKKIIVDGVEEREEHSVYEVSISRIIQEDEFGNNEDYDTQPDPDRYVEETREAYDID